MVKPGHDIEVIAVVVGFKNGLYACLQLVHKVLDLGRPLGLVLLLALVHKPTSLIKFVAYDMCLRRVARAHIGKAVWDDMCPPPHGSGHDPVFRDTPKSTRRLTASGAISGFVPGPRKYPPPHGVGYDPVFRDMPESTRRLTASGAYTGSGRVAKMDRRLTAAVHKFFVTTQRNGDGTKNHLAFRLH